MAEVRIDMMSIQEKILFSIYVKENYPLTESRERILLIIDKSIRSEYLSLCEELDTYPL